MPFYSWSDLPSSILFNPGRYKLVELLCYVIMGFFPALVVLSMVSHPSALPPV